MDNEKFLIRPSILLLWFGNKMKKITSISTRPHSDTVTIAVPCMHLAETFFSFVYLLSIYPQSEWRSWAFVSFCELSSDWRKGMKISCAISWVGGARVPWNFFGNWMGNAFSGGLCIKFGLLMLRIASSKRCDTINVF